MLSGEVPFVDNGKSLHASQILEKIREGDFSCKSESWQNVSIDAKNVVHGKHFIFIKSLMNLLFCSTASKLCTVSIVITLKIKVLTGVIQA